MDRVKQEISEETGPHDIMSDRYHKEIKILAPMTHTAQHVTKMLVTSKLLRW